MGFETGVQSQQEGGRHDYETSLWDLKLLGSTLTGTRPKNYETSLWDLKLPRGEPNFILLRL